jgi:ankyrin repeat protein
MNPASSPPSPSSSPSSSLQPSPPLLPPSPPPPPHLAFTPALYSSATSAATIDPVLGVLVELNLPESPHLNPLARAVVARLQPGELKKYAAAFVNAPDEFGRSPLRFAVELGSPETCVELLAMGADVNAADLTGATALHAAAKTGDVEVLEVLCKKEGVTLDAVAKGETPLLVAVRCMNWGAALQLVRRGASCRETRRGADGRTVLQIACETCTVERSEFLSELLGKGVDVNAKDVQGDTALHVACRRGADGLAQYLLANGAQVDAQNRLGETGLHLACVAAASRISGGHTVKHLLDAGASRSLARNDGKTASAIIEDIFRLHTLNVGQTTTLRVAAKRVDSAVAAAAPSKASSSSAGAAAAVKP